MGRSLGLGRLAVSTTFRHALSETTFKTRWDGVGLHQAIQRGGLTAEYPVAFAIGSGNHARGFLIRIQNRLFQSPIAQYPRRLTWDVAPGYETNPNPDFNRPVAAECLLCHSGSPRALKDTINAYEDPIFAAQAISCERCHGPSEEHLQKPSRRTIINPRTLAIPERDSVCEQCHLSGEVRVLNPGKDFAAFRPGERLEAFFSTFVLEQPRGELKVVSHVEQLALSSCSQKSGRLWCGTCHSLHGEPTNFRDKCLQCHDVKVSSAHPNTNEDCARCHMPKRRVIDGSHTAFTDHSIRRSPTSPMKDAGKASTLRAWRDVPDVPLKQRNLGLALIAVGERQRSAEQINRGYRILSEVFPNYRRDAEVLAALGMVLFLKDQYKDACLLLEEAVSIRPRYAPLYEKLAVVHRALGDIEKAKKALEKAIELEPVSESAYHMLANLSATPEDRTRALHRYLKVMPQSLLAREALRALPGR